jgi:hypothetical protein
MTIEYVFSVLEELRAEDASLFEQMPSAMASFQQRIKRSVREYFSSRYWDKSRLQLLFETVNSEEPKNDIMDVFGEEDSDVIQLTYE